MFLIVIMFSIVLVSDFLGLCFCLCIDLFVYLVYVSVCVFVSV